MKKQAMRWTLAGAAVLLLGGYCYEKAAEARFRDGCRTRRLLSGEWHDVRGQRLHLLRMGARQPGQPAVILEAGHGAWSAIWRDVMAEVAGFARVVAYDRSGYGWSAPRSSGHPPERMVRDLHDLLAQAGEPPPYLLVGHSLGGALVRLFASRYPDEVAGMLWVDSVSEDFLRYMPLNRPAVWAMTAGLRLGALLARVGLVRLAGLGQVLARYSYACDAQERALLVEQVVEPQFLDALADETLTLFDARGWTAALPLFDLPVTHLEAVYAPQPPFPLPQAFWDQHRARWEAMHEALALRAPRIRRVRVPGGHNIHAEQPALVAAAVREMWLELTTG